MSGWQFGLAHKLLPQGSIAEEPALHCIHTFAVIRLNDAYCLLMGDVGELG